jgi:hypothetical protein
MKHTNNFESTQKESALTKRCNQEEFCKTRNPRTSYRAVKHTPPAVVCLGQIEDPWMEQPERLPEQGGELAGIS